jgi:hypothetical protein
VFTAMMAWRRSGLTRAPWHTIRLKIKGAIPISRLSLYFNF